MKKRFLSILLTLCMGLSILPGRAWATDSEFTIENGTLTSYNGPGGDIVVPGNVTSIGMYTFLNCVNLTSVTMSSSVTKIETGAFIGCTSLSSITIPNSVISIGDSSFSECENLKNVIIPNSVTDIGDWAFANTGLISVTIPGSVTSIAERTFFNCKELKSLTLLSGVTDIGMSAFEGCESLTKITIPNTVSNIGSSAFSSCTNLENIIIPAGVTRISMYAFDNCTKLASVVLPESITKIESRTFSRCTNLVNMTIPGSITDVELEAFTESGLTQVAYEKTTADWLKITGGDISTNGLRIRESLTEGEYLYRYVPVQCIDGTIGGSNQPSDKEYTLSYNLAGGTGDVPGDMCINAGSKIQIPTEEPTRKGYTFAGWSDGQKTYQPGERFTMPEKNVTLTAQWTQQIATNPMFSYDINGGTAVGIPQSERKVPNEMIIVTTVVPERAGYRFMGWSDGQKAYKAGDFFSMPDTDLVLSAQWKKLYSLGFNPDGGTGNLPEPAFYVEGEIVMLPAAPSKDGLVFAGWSDGLHTYPAGSQFTMPRNDLVLKALWDIELLYVQQLTQYSLANADAATRETIQNAIYNLLFKAQFRPSANEVNDISFGSYSQTLTQKQVIINYWPAKNWSGASQSSIADAVLGSINLNVNSRGCYAYGKFVSKYVWGTTGSSTSRVTTAAGLKALIEAYADPGEHIRINNTHSVVFLGESSDRNGFYCSEYIDDPYGIRVTYYTYQKFAKMYSGISMFLYDTNGGSYYSETAKSIATIRAENNATTREILRFACPVEVVVKLENEILDSRSVANDGEIAFASFGSVERDDKTLVFELQHNENYKIEIVGIGEGGMTLTVEHYWNEDMIDRRIFVSVPITSKTDIEAHGFDVLGSFVLFVYPDGTEESESTWGAGAGETVYAADMSYSSRHHKYPGNDIDNNAPSVPGHSDSPISPNNLSNANYPIALSGVSNGTVSINPSKASKGTTITLTAIPNIGYKLATLTATDSKGNGLKLTDKGEGKSSFIMPASAVKVEAVFVLAEIPWTNPFSDVSNDDWHYEAVRFVQERGLMNGYSDSRFGPNEPLSRAQLAQILFNKAGRPVVNYLLNFSDVAGEAWYTEAIRWATSQGIVGGYGNGKFGPNDNITREQLAVMLWRYSGSPAATNKELNFTDADEISGFALEAMRWAVENGILNGYGDGRLGPQGQATRAQVAQMLKNYLESYQ